MIKWERGVLSLEFNLPCPRWLATWFVGARRAWLATGVSCEIRSPNGIASLTVTVQESV